MKRFAFISLAVTVIVTGLAACSDRVSQSVTAPEVADAQFAWYSPPSSVTIAAACTFFAARVADRYDLTPEEEARIREACIRLAGRLITLLPGGLTAAEICAVVKSDPEFAYLSQRIQDAINAFCAEHA